jgi:hypothetical protein
MAEKKLSDEEILKLISEFKTLSEEDKLKQLIGQGAWKNVYQSSDPDYVLKRSIDKNNNDLIKDYIASKQIGKYIPVEQPMLIMPEKDKEAYLLQKKVNLENIKNKDLEKFEKTLYDKNIELDSGDINSRNFGKTFSGDLKAIDVDPEPFSFNKTLNDSLKKTRDTAVDKLSNLKGPKIYRSIPIIGPLLGLGAAIASKDASAAIPILSEADSVGPEKETADAIIENPQANPAARRKALESILKK